MNNKQFWSFKKADEKTGELYLYGEISRVSWYGDEVTPQKFQAELDALGEIDTLKTYVNSGGGDIFAAWAIISILKRNKAYRIGYNDGLAASAAFDILMAMDKVVASEQALFMSHNCWGGVIGNRHEMRKAADLMEKIDGLMAEAAAKRSGKTVEEMVAIQDAETWYTAKQAFDEGFADELEVGKDVAAMVTPEMFAKFKHPPEFVKIDEQAEEPPDGGISLPEEPDNGGVSQPVEDNTAALAAQKDRFTRTKIKHYGGSK